MDTSNLPQWKCHKVVRAAKIDSVTVGHFSGAKLYLAGVPDPIDVSEEWQTKHAPRAGGYFVVYDDSYSSFSPAKAFEEGYTLQLPVAGPIMRNGAAADPEKFGEVVIDSAAPRALAAHQQRVIDEKKDLDEKLQKLSAFYSTPIFHGLPESEQTRLLRQGVAMRAYSQVLGERIGEF
ncbi:crAss001_48 related protein [Rhodoferax koreense]|nr:hypothetical protein [Rhodoferax koreense]